MGHSASTQFQEFLHPIVSQLINDESNTLISSEIQSMSYETFLKSLGELNILSRKCLDSEGKQLVFAVRKGTDSTVFWKATVQIACVKVNPENQKIDSYRLLTLNQFLRVFKTLKCQYTAVEQSKSVDQTDTSLDCASVKFFGDLNDLECGDSYLDPSECCICLERHIEVTLPCTHSYCKMCIEQWNESHDTCPICREKIESTDDTWVLSEVPKAEEISEEIRSDLLRLTTDKEHSCLPS